MENERVVIGALLFIAAIIGINYTMFIIARSWAKGGDSHWMNAIRKSLSQPLEGSSGKSMDELRQKVQELERNQKDEK